MRHANSSLWQIIRQLNSHTPAWPNLFFTLVKPKQILPVLTDKPTRLTVKTTGKNYDCIWKGLHLHHEQRLLQILNHQQVHILLLHIKIKKNTSRKLKSEASRKNKARHKRTHAQAHNRYDHLDHSEDEESIWNLPSDDSPSPMDESPLETRRSHSGGRQKVSQRK